MAQGDAGSQGAGAREQQHQQQKQQKQGSTGGKGDGESGGNKKVAAVPESAYSKSEHVHGKFVTIASMLALLVLTPPVAIYLWYITAMLNGSLASFYTLATDGGLEALWAVWPRPTLQAWAIIGAFAAFEALLQVVVPGKEWIGPVSPAGNRPIYWRNGFQCYLVTLAAVAVIWRSGVYDLTIVYDRFGEMLSALNIASLLVCFALYVKGNVAPSSSDWGSSGIFIQDFFWGMELYPRIGKYFDIKTFTNCRFGMMSWAVLPIIYAAKQYQLNGFVADSMVVSVALMLTYVSKFFLWEAGYWNTMDIQHDRAGYYLCWGCMVWLPIVYTSPALYLVHHPVQLGTPVAVAIFTAGVLCIFINYDADRQRTEFRATDGKCLVWGKPPVKIEATYVTEKGETKQSLLLASGWWGLARHFHYVPEILAAFFWSVPGLFDHVIQYFYVIYLTILLMDRAIRDDQRCRRKYGKYWDMYCKRVPYKVIPGIY